MGTADASTFFFFLFFFLLMLLTGVDDFHIHFNLVWFIYLCYWFTVKTLNFKIIMINLNFKKFTEKYVIISPLALEQF